MPNMSGLCIPVFRMDSYKHYTLKHQSFVAERDTDLHGPRQSPSFSLVKVQVELVTTAVVRRRGQVDLEG